MQNLQNFDKNFDSYENDNSEAFNKDKADNSKGDMGIYS